MNFFKKLITFIFSRSFLIFLGFIAEVIGFIAVVYYFNEQFVWVFAIHYILSIITTIFIINKDLLYTHNDSGGEPSVFALDTQGRFLAEIVIEGAKNRDWEDIATATDPQDGKAYIYIGEIGDNGSKHPSVKVYRALEPTITKADSIYHVTDVQTYNIAYED